MQCHVAFAVQDLTRMQVNNAAVAAVGVRAFHAGVAPAQIVANGLARGLASTWEPHTEERTRHGLCTTCPAARTLPEGLDEGRGHDRFRRSEKPFGGGDLGTTQGPAAEVMQRKAKEIRDKRYVKPPLSSASLLANGRCVGSGAGLASAWRLCNCPKPRIDTPTPSHSWRCGRPTPRHGTGAKTTALAKASLLVHVQGVIHQRLMQELILWHLRIERGHALGKSKPQAR